MRQFKVSLVIDMNNLIFFIDKELSSNINFFLKEFMIPREERKL